MPLLYSVLGLCRRRRLPLHVARRIGAAALKWNEVIDDEPRTRPRGPAGCRAGMDGLECSPVRRAPRDLSIGSAGAGRALCRRGLVPSGVRPSLRSAGESGHTAGSGAGGAAAGGGPLWGPKPAEGRARVASSVLSYMI